MIDQEEVVVLVDKNDKVIGSMDKLKAHEQGALHQAISIIVFNKKGQMLLQQRAEKKYHWANIWSNTVCTHPRENESHQASAERRLVEELGFSTELNEVFSFIYKAEDASSGLIEHEYDHVFIGEYEGVIPFNEDEVQAVQWIEVADLLEDVKQDPEKYSFWFKIILEEMVKREMLSK
jgi:isopentenyl-diphosphate delta-isomerase